MPTCGQIAGVTFSDLHEIQYKGHRFFKKAQQISSDPSSIGRVQTCFHKMRNCRTKRYKNSLIPVLREPLRDKKDSLNLHIKFQSLFLTFFWCSIWTVMWSHLLNFPFCRFTSTHCRGLWMKLGCPSVAPDCRENIMTCSVPSRTVTFTQMMSVELVFLFPPLTFSIRIPYVFERLPRLWQCYPGEDALRDVLEHPLTSKEKCVIFKI